MNLLVYLTFPRKEDAIAAARDLVRRRLAAGVNILPGALSVYRWQGEVCEREECLVFAQIEAKIFKDFEKFIASRHPDIVPCVLALPVECGSSDFMQWIQANCGKGE